MQNVVMGNLDGKIERIAFSPQDIERVITHYNAGIVSSADDQGLLLELDGQVFPLKGTVDKEDIKPYFIVLKSGIAFNASDCKMLFNTKELPNSLLSGIDATGNQYLCSIYNNGSGPEDESGKELVDLKAIDEKIEAGDLSPEDIEDLKDVIERLKKGEFFELLTMEFSGKIKGLAKELIDFRKDIQTKIEPDIVEIASKDIPEASNQLEGINETLEDSTMKIMDINEAQMETANKQQKALESILARDDDKGEGITVGISLEETIKAIEGQMDVLKEIEKRSLDMMEPLSFQDLVGQRIQRIIKLVRSMEIRIEELIVSFGIKLQKHNEDPTRTYEDLNKDVDDYMNELKGPQRAGEGLDQAGIDSLLGNL